VDIRSRMVALFKVLLPLTALGILSTLFLLSRSIDPTAKIPFAEQEMADRLRNQQVTGPVYSGITDNGDEITVTASLARPGGSGAPSEAINLDALIVMGNGQRITLTSDTGTLSADGGTATFTGNVEIISATGIVVRTEALNAALNAIEGDTPGTVTATAPFGDLTAGNMQLREKSDGGPLHMIFNNGVKLIYDPKVSDR